MINFFLLISGIMHSEALLIIEIISMYVIDF